MPASNHQLRQLPVTEADGRILGLECTAPRCREAPTHVSTADITGKTGRVGTRERKLCPRHAYWYSIKHELRDWSAALSGHGPLGDPATGSAR